MEQKDWIMRQVEAVSFSFAKMMFNKERPAYEIVYPDQQMDTDLLHTRLIELLAASKINEAENLLFECLETYDSKYYQIALDFYYKLSEYDDAYLEHCNFLRQEVDDGLLELKRLFGLDE